jgi:hypothetical protein
MGFALPDQPGDGRRPARRCAAAALLSVAVLVALGGEVRAGTVLFRSGSGLSGGHNVFSAEQTFVAQDFELDRDAALDGVVFSALTTDATVPVTAVHVRFYEDDAGRVGDGIYSAVLPASSSVVGPAESYIMRDYTVVLPDVVLAAGRYWMGLRADPPQVDLHWVRVEDQQFGYDGYVGDDEGDPASYESYLFEHVFTLTGTANSTVIPLPPALWAALMTAAVALSLRAANRRRPAR